MSSREKQELEEFEFQLRSQEESTATREQPQAEAATTDQQAQGTFVDPSDGTVYEWDYAKRAWFPKVCFPPLQSSYCTARGLITQIVHFYCRLIMIS